MAWTADELLEEEEGEEEPEEEESDDEGDCALQPQKPATWLGWEDKRGEGRKEEVVEGGWERGGREGASEWKRRREGRVVESGHSRLEERRRDGRRERWRVDGRNTEGESSAG